MFGEMGREVLLASQRVRPTRLEQDGFTYLHPQLEDALLDYARPPPREPLSGPLGFCSRGMPSLRASIERGAAWLGGG